MVIKTICDRCKKIIKSENHADIFEGMGFDDKFEDKFEDLNHQFRGDGSEKVLRFHLCGKCTKDYNKIIKKTNDELKRFLTL